MTTTPAAHLARWERSGLCDALIRSGPGAPTLCEGWLTRDLAAHVFVRERRPLAASGIVLGGTFAKLTASSMRAALRTYGYVGLVARVRSGPPLLWRPVDDLVNLVEFFVHTEDVRRAAPDWEARNDPQLDGALWASLGRWSKMMTRKLQGAGLELQRPDGERIVAHRGGPSAVLSGGPQELVLFLYGRAQVARVALSGAEEAQRAVREARFGI